VNSPSLTSPLLANTSKCLLSSAQETSLPRDTFNLETHDRESSISATPSTGKLSFLLSESSSPSEASESPNASLPQLLIPTPKQYICQEPGCSERFTQQRQLEKHKKRHKRYLCNECTKSYSHPKNLREHRVSQHQGLRYSCDVPGCFKTVAQKKNLARHKASKHGLEVDDG
jgi:hypothetical protein